MSYKPFKFIVTAVCLSVEGDEIVGEVSSDPVTVYGVPALIEWANGFEESLSTATIREVPTDASAA
jgi:hypothetical protein